MNYLAHLLLADPTGHARIGGLLGDFVKGELVGTYGHTLEVEMTLHRLVDTWTDAHPFTQDCKRHFPPAQRRFAGVVLDVYFDHLLMQHWHALAHTPFEAFAQDTYALLLRHQPTLPEPLRSRIAPMVQGRFLHAYGSLAGVERVVQRIASHWRHGDKLLPCLPTLHTLPASVSLAFPAFFNELAAGVAAQRQVLSAALQWPAPAR